jgi:hypothetical protein
MDPISQKRGGVFYFIRNLIVKGGYNIHTVQEWLGFQKRRNGMRPDQKRLALGV